MHDRKVTDGDNLNQGESWEQFIYLYLRAIGRLTLVDECLIEVGDDIDVGDESCLVCGPV